MPSLPTHEPRELSFVHDRIEPAMASSPLFKCLILSLNLPTSHALHDPGRKHPYSSNVGPLSRNGINFGVPAWFCRFFPATVSCLRVQGR
jgi:hypothetical protein